MNPGTLVIVNLLGGIALLLWGVRMVRTGVMRAWGDRLKSFIEHRLDNRVSAFLAGGVATAILGSGTAMTLILAGIAAAGAIGTSLGLAVLLGADVGSALVSAVFTSGSSLALWASPILLFVGYVTFSVSEEFRPHNVGRILIGLGLMLLSLQLIKAASAPLGTATLFHELLAAVGREALLAFIIGAGLAWMFHSTLAVILLVATFLANGSLEIAGAIAFILGINFGGGLPAVTATLALPAAARRLPLANLLCRGIAAIAALVGIDWIIPLVTRLPLPPVETAVTFHTAFNVATGLLFLPLTGFVAAAMRRLVPDEKQEADRLASPRYLDIAAMATPSVALSNAMLETVRMSEVLDRMFDTALAALRTGSLETLKQLKPLDERLNAYQAALQSYLSDLAQQPLGAEDSRRILELTLYISNLEHAGDVIHLNLSDRIKAKAKQSVAFSPEEQASLDDLCLIVHQNIRLATGVLSSGDIEGAKRLIAQKGRPATRSSMLLACCASRGCAALAQTFRLQDLPDRKRSLVDDLGQLRIRHVVGRCQDHDVAADAIGIAAHRIADEPIVEGLLTNLHEELALGRKGSLRRTISHQLDGLEVTPAANVADSIDAGESIGQQGRELRAVGAHALHQLLACDDALHRNSGSAAGGMSREGMSGHRCAMLAMDGIGHLVGIDRGTQRQVAGSQPLGHRHDVGLDAVMFQRPPGADAARAAHDLVRDHQHAASARRSGRRSRGSALHSRVAPARSRRPHRRQARR